MEITGLHSWRGDLVGPELFINKRRDGNAEANKERIIMEGGGS